MIRSVDDYLKEHEKGGRGARVEEYFNKLSDNTSWFETELETEINSGSRSSQTRKKMNTGLLN